MTLTLTIDDPAEATRVVEGLCDATRYDPASGKTKAQWVKDKLINYMKVIASRGESQTTASQINTEIAAINIY